MKDNGGCFWTIASGEGVNNNSFKNFEQLIFYICSGTTREIIFYRNGFYNSKWMREQENASGVS